MLVQFYNFVMERSEYIGIQEKFAYYFWRLPMYITLNKYLL